MSRTKNLEKDKKVPHCNDIRIIATRLRFRVRKITKRTRYVRRSTWGAHNDT